MIAHRRIRYAAIIGRPRGEASSPDDLATEQSARQSADTQLSQQLALETGHRAGADGVLGTRITAEEGARAAANVALQGLIDTLSASVSDEVAARLAADLLLQAAIDLKANLAAISAVGLSGAYADLTGKPTLGTAADNAEGDFATAAQGAKADTALQPGGAPKTLFDHFADAGNGTTVETDLYSDSIPAGRLAANGEKLEAQYTGVFVSSATATRQIRIYFGGAEVFNTGALTLSLSSAWDVYVEIIRASSSVVRLSVSLSTQGAALSAYTSYAEITGLTLANAQILKITAQAAGVGAASNDVVARLGSVKWIASA